MNNDTQFDFRTCALDGRTLVAAAAGTGKTYNIERLAARFIVERGVPVESLAVVTFTNAAAAELRERIRAVLARLENYIVNNISEGDAQELFQVTAANSGLDLDEFTDIAATRLRNAIRDFDSASISTIHTFCARVLRENAFESKRLFNSELDNARADATDEFYSDYRRKCFYDPLNGALNSMFESASGENMRESVNVILKHDSLEVIYPSVTSMELAGFADPDTRDQAHLCDAFRRIHSELTEICADENFFSSCANSIGSIFTPASRGKLAAACAGGNDGVPSPAIFHAVAGYTQERIYAKRKKAASDDDVAAVAASRLCVLASACCALLKMWKRNFIEGALDFVRERTRLRRESENVMSFDDLLKDVRDSMRESPELTALLRKKYQAGIIDEFQDTDPIQYEIFSTIFDAPGHAFFMVGDPRQAIYAFRGGDMAAYLRAERETLASPNGRRRVLSVNHRSSPALVDDLNVLFGEHTFPFADENIRFDTVSSPAAAQEAERFAQNGRNVENPLRIFELDQDEDPLEQAAALAERLAGGSFTLPAGDGTARPLAVSDIAFLVRSSFEEHGLRHALLRRGIPAVSTSTGSVYATEEATELLDMIRAMLNPSDRAARAAALVTHIAGVSIDTLAKTDAETFSGEQSGVFRSLFETWERHSFAAMFAAMLEVFNVHSRYLEWDSGERRIANLLHLSDLLQTLAVENRCGPGGLARIFEAKTASASDTSASDEELVRLETDRDSAVISTMHKSKGLEYPVVIIPGLHLFRGKADHIRTTPFHMEDGRLAFIPGAADTPAVTETFEERLRVAYVALTRAKYACFAFYSHEAEGGRNSGASVLDWLFKARNVDPETMRDKQALKAFISQLSSCPAFIPERLLDFSFERPEAQCTARDSENGSVRIAFPEWRGRLLPDLKRTSFSSLVHDSVQTSAARSETERDFFDADASDIPDVQDTLKTTENVFSELPRGMSFGSAVHSVMEKLDFESEDHERLARLVKREFDAFGILSSETIIETACEMIEAVLALEMKDIDGKGFTLRNIGMRDRIRETAFDFTTGAFSMNNVANLFPEKSISVYGRDLPRGIMKGFIDMVFRLGNKYYILDWKTNAIGGTHDSFNQQGLSDETDRHFYYLQYCIYTAALMKYLFIRLPDLSGRDPSDKACFTYAYEQFFGGVRYVYMRGAPFGKGVFSDRPSAEKIFALTLLLHG